MEADKKEVISLYISLIEKIANGRTNVLDFGSEDMTFYRGEIHIIKIIGDSPGIYSSEIARYMGITRAVVHKTLLKLEKRDLIEKKDDEEDKKIRKIYLTQKGKEAYDLHAKYHEKHDKQFFDYIRNLNDIDTQTVKTFLEKARDMIGRHF